MKEERVFLPKEALDNKYSVELIFPNGRAIVEERFTKAMAEIVAKKLTPAELDKYIELLEEMPGDTIMLV